LSQCLAHSLQGNGQMLEDQLGFEAQHAVTEAAQLAITPGIGSALELMAATVDFHDEFRLWSYQVDNEPSDDHLPAKGNAQLPGAKRVPQNLLRPGRISAEELGAMNEELLGFRLAVGTTHEGSPWPGGVAGLCDPWRKRCDTPTLS
jgi:hypothetical protein